ncbi:hypothetical protein IGI04_002527, partial [Brassica rapa subsp. trilocularis]
VFGQFIDLGAIATVQVKEKDRKKVQFRFIGHAVACCLWGKYAEQIETQMEEAKDETIICLIKFAKNKILQRYTNHQFI